MSTAAPPADSAAAGEPVEEVELRLLAEFAPGVPVAVVHRCVEEAAARFAAAPIRTYVPLLVERRARRTLGALTGYRRHD